MRAYILSRLPIGAAPVLACVAFTHTGRSMAGSTRRSD